MAAIVIVSARDFVDVVVFTTSFLHKQAMLFLPSEPACQQIRAL